MSTRTLATNVCCCSSPLLFFSLLSFFFSTSRSSLTLPDIHIRLLQCWIIPIYLIRANRVDRAVDINRRCRCSAAAAAVRLCHRYECPHVQRYDGRTSAYTIRTERRIRVDQLQHARSAVDREAKRECRRTLLNTERRERRKQREKNDGDN